MNKNLSINFYNKEKKRNFDKITFASFEYSNLYIYNWNLNIITAKICMHLSINYVKNYFLTVCRFKFIKNVKYKDHSFIDIATFFEARVNS